MSELTQKEINRIKAEGIRMSDDKKITFRLYDIYGFQSGIKIPPELDGDDLITFSFIDGKKTQTGRIIDYRKAMCPAKEYHENPFTPALNAVIAMLISFIILTFIFSLLT